MSDVDSSKKLTVYNCTYDVAEVRCIEKECGRLDMLVIVPSRKVYWEGDYGQVKLELEDGFYTGIFAARTYGEIDGASACFCHLVDVTPILVEPQ